MNTMIQKEANNVKGLVTANAKFYEVLRDMTNRATSRYELFQIAELEEAYQQVFGGLTDAIQVVATEHEHTA